MSKKKVYYAHSVGLYNTPQEDRDIKTLIDMGFEVINPNQKEISENFKKQWDKNPLINYEEAFNNVFGGIVRTCDLLAFRAQSDGLIGTGVAKEIDYAKELNKPIIELPSALYKRIATPSQTRAYLEEIGQR